MGAAIYPDQVRAVLRRMPRVVVSGGRDEPWRVHLAVSAESVSGLESVGLLVTPPGGVVVGDVTYTPMNLRLNPVSDVWDRPGLAGWHSLVFDTVSALGTVKVPSLVDVTLLPKASVCRIVNQLAECGLVEKSAGNVSVAATAADVEGTDVKRVKVAARVEKEARKLRELRGVEAELWAGHEGRLAELERRRVEDEQALAALGLR